MPDGKIRIGVMAPSSRLKPGILEQAERLAARHFPTDRYELVLHPQCLLQAGHFAGPDALRAAALLELANDPTIDALWFAHGGYGSFRLLDRVMPHLLAPARNKIYLGYSDVGSLLGAFQRNGIGRPVHGPMPADIRRPGGDEAVLRALSFLILGAEDGIEQQVGTGLPAAAFNITILAHLAGTPFMPDLSGYLLMLEDVSEPIYRLDRCLGQIFSTPALGRPAGIRLGRCSDIIPNDPDFGQSEEEIVQHWCERSGIPYLGRADIGHDGANKIVPFGPWRMTP